MLRQCVYAPLFRRIRCASSAIRFVSVGEVGNHWSLREKHVLLHIVHIVILI